MGKTFSSFHVLRILAYNDLHVTRVKTQFDRAIEELRNGQFRAAEVKKLGGTPYYRKGVSSIRMSLTGENKF